jgi:hypothetical protein
MSSRELTGQIPASGITASGFSPVPAVLAQAEVFVSATRNVQSATSRQVRCDLSGSTYSVLDWRLDNTTLQLGLKYLIQLIKHKHGFVGCVHQVSH